MREHGSEQHVHAHEATFDGACATCDGPLRARVTTSGVWGWCATCRRLSRALVMPGPTGPIFMHPAAAA